MTQRTPFEQQIHDVLELMYQRMCGDVQGMIDELPPGSSIGSYGDSYIVKMPIGSVTGDTVADVYKAAMEMVNDSKGMGVIE